MALLEDRFSQLGTAPGVEPGPSLDDLARTQIENDIDSALEPSTPGFKKKETTSPEVRLPKSLEVDATADAHEVDVPIQLSVSPDAEEVDVKITLRLKINRKVKSEE